MLISIAAQLQNPMKDLFDYHQVRGVAPFCVKEKSEGNLDFELRYNTVFGRLVTSIETDIVTYIPYSHWISNVLYNLDRDLRISVSYGIAMLRWRFLGCGDYSTSTKINSLMKSCCLECLTPEQAKEADSLLNYKRAGAIKRPEASENRNKSYISKYFPGKKLELPKESKAIKGFLRDG